MSDELCYLSATEALARFKTGALSPVELITAVIARAQAIADTINPFADKYFDEAIARARKAEAKYARRNARTRRLEGLPLAVKDSFSMETVDETELEKVNLPTHQTQRVRCDEKERQIRQVIDEL